MTLAAVETERHFVQVGRQMLWAKRANDAALQEGGPLSLGPPKPSGFDEEIQRLGLDEQTYPTSPELRQWFELNKDRCYIPEWLLKKWGMSVDVDLSA